MQEVNGLILARAGSVRIPGKNLKLFYGKPLIVWTIEEALKSTSIARTIVSTDSQYIAQVSKTYGAEVPFLRPSRLALSSTPSIDSILHAVEELKLNGEILLLQPTSPLRTVKDIEEIIQLYRSTNSFSCVSVVRSENCEDAIFLDKESRICFPFEKNQSKCDKKNPYKLNGALYIASVDFIKRHKSFISQNTMAYIMPKERSVDLDTYHDWDIGESLMKLR